MNLQPIDTADKGGGGETLRLQLADGRIVAGYWDANRNAWAWLNGHAGLCYAHAASDYPVAWAPLVDEAGMNETAKRMQMHEAELRDEKAAKEE